MSETTCLKCGDSYEEEDGVDFVDGICRYCRRKMTFAEFAKSCGLKAFPRPDGERHLYNINGKYGCKKSEYIKFMDELWNALVRAKGGSDDLLLGE